MQEQICVDIIAFNWIYDTLDNPNIDVGGNDSPSDFILPDLQRLFYVREIIIDVRPKAAQIFFEAL